MTMLAQSTVALQRGTILEFADNSGISFPSSLKDSQSGRIQEVKNGARQGYHIGILTQGDLRDLEVVLREAPARSGNEAKNFVQAVLSQALTSCESGGVKYEALLLAQIIQNDIMANSSFEDALLRICLTKSLSLQREVVFPLIHIAHERKVKNPEADLRSIKSQYQDQQFISGPVIDFHSITNLPGALEVKAYALIDQEPPRQISQKELYKEMRERHLRVPQLSEFEQHLAQMKLIRDQTSQERNQKYNEQHLSITAVINAALLHLGFDNMKVSRIATPTSGPEAVHWEIQFVPR